MNGNALPNLSSGIVASGTGVTVNGTLIIVNAAIKATDFSMAKIVGGQGAASAVVVTTEVSDGSVYVTQFSGTDYNVSWIVFRP